MKFIDFKHLDYPDDMPIEDILSDLMYKKQINVNTILLSYTNAIERENHINYMRFEEACVNITQLLGKHFKGEDKIEAIKRAIHTFNLNHSLVKYVHDKQYNYTKEDEDKWDRFCRLIYGTTLKD